MYKKKERIFFTRILLLLVMMVIVVGCSSNSGSSEKSSSSNDSSSGENVDSNVGTPQNGGEVVIAYDSDINNYDPIKGSSGKDHSLLWPVYDTLIKFTPELEPQPGLAESWEFPDDKTIVLHLRKGVTFQDGTSFNAEAVKFNIERVNSEDSTVTDLENIKSVEVVNDTSVKLHLSQPDSSILMALSDRGGMMVSPTAIEEQGENYSQNPIGAGPYKMVNRVPNGEIVLEAFENYWQEGQPYLDKMTIKIMEKENTRINALKSGEVDFADNITPVNVKSLENSPNILLKERLTLAFQSLGINASKPPLDNKAVRQAIHYGINREALVQAINFGKGEPAVQLFPSEYWAADKDLKAEYNPEKAKQLLLEAGLENVSFEMVYYTDEHLQKIGEAIKSHLSEIGIQVDIQAMEINAANEHYYTKKEVPVYLAGWSGRPDPQMTIKSQLHKDSFYNAGSYSTDEIEGLISEAASTYENDKRSQIYKEINNKAILDEVIFIPLIFTPKVSAMNESVKGFEQNLYGKAVFSTIWKQ